MKNTSLKSLLTMAILAFFVWVVPFKVSGDNGSFFPDDTQQSSHPVIGAPSALLLDLERGQILYSKNSGDKLHISTANKVMTAVLAIEKTTMDAKVTISKESVETEGSVLYLSVGGKYLVEELLNAIIVANANDATNALAEHFGGSIDSFVETMNKKAQDLGMKNTRFKNPTGLFDQDQYTTAFDLGILMRYALTLPDFSRIFSYRAVPWADHQGVEILTNLNRLFWTYEGIDGGKTGFNRADMQSSVTTASRSSRRLLAIVLDATEKSVFTDSQNLLDFGFDNFKRSLLITRNQPLYSMTLANNEVSLISIADIYYVHPLGENYVAEVEFSLVQNLELPLLSSRLCGMARYTLKDKTIIDVNLYPDREIYLPETLFGTFVDRIKEQRDLYLLIIALCILLFLLSVSHGINYIRRHMASKKNGQP